VQHRRGSRRSARLHEDFQAKQKEALLRMAAEVWNRFNAPVSKQKDVVLLAVYSHVIQSNLYLPDYPIGHLIAHQLAEHMRTPGKIDPEIERVPRQGDISPDLWMQGATGVPVGAAIQLSKSERPTNETEGSGSAQ
jgi:hypothetical protein